jgi:hypothetical protein
MPYIKQEDRIFLDQYIEELASAINTKLPNGYETDNVDVMEFAGEVNYSITRLCCLVMGKNQTYPKIAIITGVLENVKQEFYRRLAAPYEENKIVQNGDVKEYKNLNIWR